MDAVYKPILRKFRTYLRDQFDGNHKKKGYVHWKIEQYMHHVRAFMVNNLDLPAVLLDTAGIAKMLTLLFPCTTKHALPNLREPVDRVLLAQVFRENNNLTRTQFFSDPLIKHLWSKIFVGKNPEILITYLRRLRSHDTMGEAKYRRYTRDMMQLEMEVNCKLLPDTARDPANIVAFSEKEK